LLDTSSKAANEKDLIATLGLPEISMPEAVEGLDLLKELRSDDSVKQQYITASRKRWPEATVFASS
jgi:hypothetical protein